MPEIDAILLLIPPIDLDTADPETREYITLLDAACDAAMSMADGLVDYAPGAEAIGAWLAVSQRFFDSLPPGVEPRQIPNYVEVHNILLSTLHAAQAAGRYEWRRD